MAQKISPEDAAAHWRETRSLMWSSLFAWALFAFVAPLIAEPLNAVTIPGINAPLGYFMVAQGALIVFVVMIFRFSARQNAIDEKYNVHED